jgi:hypothetical protein
LQGASAMTIYNNSFDTKPFKPTRLYIKKLVGIYYFGKTSVNDIGNYTGSGKLWKDRIKKYGKDKIETLWVSDWYYDPTEILEAASQFSLENDIENSPLWANLKLENGIDGGYPGHLGCQKISKSLKGNHPWNKGKILTDEKYKIGGRKNKGKTPINKGIKWSEGQKSEYKKILKSKRRSFTGSNNPMYGKSAVKENNLRWYTNGQCCVYITEGTQQEGYYLGRGTWKNRFKGGKKTNRKLNPCVDPGGKVYKTVLEAATYENVSAKAIIERIRRYERSDKTKSGWKYL